MCHVHFFELCSRVHNIFQRMCDHSYQYDEIMESPLALQMIFSITTSQIEPQCLYVYSRFVLHAVACDTF